METGRGARKLSPRLKTRRKKHEYQFEGVWPRRLLALATFVAQPVKADDWNKRTEFQFSSPVEIPGRVRVSHKSPS
jgi:hypothetical protein